MAALDVLKDIAPEFEANEEAQLLRFIGYAQSRMDSSVWGAGSKYELASALLAAHLLTSRGADKGPAIVMEKVGELQTQYATPTQGDSALDRTSYGREYRQMSRTLCVGPLMT